MAFRDAASSFFSKDAKGVFGGLMKTLGAGLKGSLKRAELGSTNIADKLGSTGLGIATRGKEKGGAGGTAMAGVGKALQGLGGMFAKLGPTLNTVAKLGPLLGVASSALMAVVKIFIDAEAQAKQFQKEVLQSASTAEHLAAAGGDAEFAFSNLSSTMREIRDSAYSLDNLKWGITADDHKQVLNVLNQEGVSLRRIEEEAQGAKKTVGQFAAELTHVSVAYSRAFGVPLQEINQMQAEMMNDLGMSLETTRLQFAQMTRSATESGIAANKFFAIIRGVSADLSLYNSRLEDAVKTLKALGKVMNPREAQKFMQTAMQGLKNMGRQERLRMTLLAGTGKMSKLIERDMKTKRESIARQIAETGKFSAEDAAKTLQSGNKAAINDMINKLPDEMQGAIREGVIQLDLQKSRGGKGTFGVSGAAANLGPAGALEAMKLAVGMGSGEKLQGLAGTIKGEMMAENLGISQEQLDQMIKFEAAMDMERASLKSIFEKQAAGRTLEADELARLQKAQSEGILSGTDVDKAGYDQIYGTMDENQKKQHEDATKIESLGEKQARLTSNMLDKLETLINFIMNQVYNVLLDIWEGILSSIPESLRSAVVDDHLKRAANMRAAKIGGPSQEVAKIAQEGGDVRAKLKASDAMKAWNKLLDDVVKPENLMSEEENFKLKTLRERKESESYMNRELGEEDAKALAGLELKNKRAQELGKAVNRTASFLGTERKQDESASDFVSRMRDAPVKGDEVTALIAMSSIVNYVSKAGYYDPASGKALDSPDPKLLETTSVSTEATAKAAEQTHETLSKDNTAYFRFSTSFLRGDYKRTMENVLLSSIRKALFEFYMYSQMDPGEVAKFLSKNGMTAEQFAETVGREAEEGRTPKDFTGGLEYTQAPGNADGGLVTGVNGGLAMVRAAAGEGLASIGPGERILPAGAGRGGDQFNINVSGIGGNDLARFLQVKVADGIVEYKRRQRFV